MSSVTAAQRQACVDLAVAERAERIVEIGVYGGRLSRMLLGVPSLKMLYLVDSWEGSSENRQPPFFLTWNPKQMALLAEKVKTWAAGTPNVKVLHMCSIEAANLFDEASVDFVYVDGDHTHDGVRADIMGWMPKVRIGGVLCGDDYGMPSVRAAVDELLPQREIASNGRLWWARKVRTYAA
jgi:hypothetical protein